MLTTSNVFLMEVILLEKVMQASRVGFPCERNLWYSVNDGFTEVINERSRRIYETGTWLESLVVTWLRQDGWDVDYNPGSQEADLELTIPLVGGKLVGHPDGFISKPGSGPFLIDIKTFNNHAFTSWKRNGTERISLSTWIRFMCTRKLP